MDEGAHVAPAAVNIVFRGVDVDRERPHPASMHSFDFDRESRCGQSSLHGFQRSAGVEQSAEQHVSCDTADTVDVQTTRHQSPGLVWAVPRAVRPGLATSVIKLLL